MATLAPPEQTSVQMQLARYYLHKLRAASAAVQHGQGSAAYGLEMLNQEWEQIEHWQAYAAEHRSRDAGWARLCMEFPLAGVEVLALRQSIAGRVRWLRAGLEAAEMLANERAELAILDELSGAYQLLGDLPQAENCATRLLERAEALQDKLAIGRAYYRLGSLDEERGRYPQGREKVQYALNIFQQQGAQTDAGRALQRLGAIALYSSEYEQAYHHFSRHLEIMEAAGRMSEVCTGLLSIAQALMLLDEIDRAEPYIRRAVQLSRLLGYQRLLGAGLIMLGQWTAEQGQMEQELQYYAQGIAAARAAGSQRDVIHGLSNSGLARMHSGDLQGALRDLQAGLELARQAGLPRFICNLQRNIADAYLLSGEAEKARRPLEEALRLAGEQGSIYPVIKALTSAVHYLVIQERFSEAAVWAGALIGRHEVDQRLFIPLLARLEAALGRDVCWQTLNRGRDIDIQASLPQILEQIGQPHSDTLNDTIRQTK
ncbi:MAG: tetratricopeptide repeat protein [Chloroflexi bacterium]|jgi:tetratricopeptide (TPR) repeat protein|nr:tetratricopeptide repeat protein [Chloroflexota bacterium]